MAEGTEKPHSFFYKLRHMQTTLKIISLLIS